MLFFLFFEITQSLITKYQVQDLFNSYTPIDFQVESGYATGLQQGAIYYSLLYQVGKNEKTITDSDVLLIWVSGELGCSSQIAFYDQVGPFEIMKSNSDYVITRRKTSWNEFSSILFVDSLFGAGFSYGENLISSTQEASKYFVEFMAEFLKDHTEFATISTYLTGTGYAGHFVPYFSQSLIDQQIINYKGIIIGSAFSSLLQQIPSTSSSLLVNGLIDQNTNLANKAQEANIQYLILKKQDQLAGQFFEQYYQQFQTVKSNEQDWFNFMKQHKEKFGINSSSQVCNSDVKKSMASDLSFDLSSILVTLLTKGSILYYNGQMDYQINNAGIYNFITSLRSEEIEQWKQQSKQIFKVNGKTVGHYRKSAKFTLSIIYNAGHDSIINLNVFEMIKHHLNGDIDWI